MYDAYNLIFIILLLRATNDLYITTFQCSSFAHAHALQDQDSLLVKRRNDNHSPGPVIRELVPSSHQRSELSNTIVCIFSR